MKGDDGCISELLGRKTVCYWIFHLLRNFIELLLEPLCTITIISDFSKSLLFCTVHLWKSMIVVKKSYQGSLPGVLRGGNYGLMS